MAFFILTMAITVLSNVGYHFFQRSIPSTAHPLISVAVSYVAALLATLIALPIFLPLSDLWGAGLRAQFGKLNWASAAVGISAIGLEIGFLLAYRAGWKLSTAALISNACVALILIPVGLVAFGEELSTSRVVGIGAVLVGLALIGRG